MADFLNLTMSIHVGFVYLALLFSVAMFLIMKRENPKKTYMSVLPLYYGVLACLAFTGITMYVALGFSGIVPIVMVVLFLHVLISTIKTYKICKNEAVLSEKSIRTIQIKYITNIAIFIGFIIYRFV